MARIPRRLLRGGGFSLIEVIAVMLIVSVLSAVTVLSLTKATSNRARIAARQLQRDLTYARQRAVATGLGCWVVFHETNETWTVLEEDPASPGRAGAQVIIDTATSNDFVTTLNTGRFVGVTITTADFGSGTDEVGFNWLGQPFDLNEDALTATGTVTLTDSHQVTVQPETGYAAYVSP